MNILWSEFIMLVIVWALITVHHGSTVIYPHKLSYKQPKEAASPAKAIYNFCIHSLPEHFFPPPECDDEWQRVTLHRDRVPMRKILLRDKPQTFVHLEYRRGSVHFIQSPFITHGFMRWLQLVGLHLTPAWPLLSCSCAAPQTGRLGRRESRLEACSMTFTSPSL